MANLNLKINNKSYAISCDDGQEQRVLELADFVDGHVRAVAQSGAAQGEAHSTVLASLMISNEIFELKEQVACLEQHLNGDLPAPQPQAPSIDEAGLAERIGKISARVRDLDARIKQVA